MNAKPLMVGLFGARGTGKTTRALQHIRQAKPQRLLVWDFKHDPRLDGSGEVLTDAAALARRMCGASWKLRYLVDHRRSVREQFEHFCGAAWLAGDLTMYVGELAEVTAPGRAPPVWKQCVNVGREYRRADGRVVGLHIVGDSQRLAECDRSFTGNLDWLWCGRQGNENDAKAAAALLNVPWRQLLELPDLQYFERKAGGAPATKGVLRIR